MNVHQILNEELIAVVRARCSLEDWNTIVDAAVQNAKRGDSQAREWLTTHLSRQIASYSSEDHGA